MTLDLALGEVVRQAVAPLVQQVAELTAAVEALRTPTTPESALLSVREFAARAGISQCTCRRRVSDGTIASVRVGASIRIPAASLRPTDPATVARLVREARS
jgi:excisionase family DNA binding protein